MVFHTLNGDFEAPPFHIHCRSIVRPWQPGYISKAREEANAELQRRPMKQRRIGPDGPGGRLVPPTRDNPPEGGPPKPSPLEVERQKRVKEIRAELDELIKKTSPPATEETFLKALQERMAYFEISKKGQRKVLADAAKALAGDKSMISKMKMSGFLDDQWKTFLDDRGADAENSKVSAWERLARLFVASDYSPAPFDEFVDIIEKYDSKLKPEAVRLYESEHFSKINRGLRDNDLTSEVSRIVSGIDSEMNKRRFVTDKPTVFYRGVYSPKGFGEPGEFTVEPGYSSTTVSRKVAETFAEGGYMVEVHVPSGIKYLPGKTGEREVILPRNAVYRTVSKNDETRTIVVQLIEAG